MYILRIVLRSEVIKLEDQVRVLPDDAIASQPTFSKPFRAGLYPAGQ